MGFHVTTADRSLRVGTYGAQSYFAAALLTGYALARLDGWERVAARWVEPNMAMVDWQADHPGHLHLLRGRRLHNALEQWARYECEGGSVLTDAPAAINLGRKMKPPYGALAQLLAAYDPVAARDLAGELTGPQAAQLAPLVAQCAAQLDGYAGGWQDVVTEYADLLSEAGRLGQELRFG